MGRKCVCQICKTKKDSSEMYKYVHFTRNSDKPKNKYYCSRDEFHEDLMNKKYYNKTQLLVDKIIGYTCINNQKNKMITNLYSAGYSRKHVLYCMKHYSDEITIYMEKKNINNEYSKLRYIFTVIENNIKDFVITEGSRNVTKINIEPETETQEDIKPDIEIVSQPKNRRRSLRDRLKGE